MELFRILVMMAIVAHHYVVNSGLTDLISQSAKISKNDIFLLLFGWGGKTGINCFVFITGYFMCKMRITAKKLFKLLGQIMFYNIVFYCIFLFSGYSAFSFRVLLKSLFPFFFGGISSNFTVCFLYFYLMIPFLNKLTGALSKKEHLTLTGLLLFIYTILPTFTLANVTFNYVMWFCVLYFVSSYVRLYPCALFDSPKVWGILSIVALILCCTSITVLYCAGSVIDRWAGKVWIYYFFVSDSNKVLAVASAFCLFMFFKNANIPQCRFINAVASSCFGVLLIHANSDTMRQWLWRDTLRNTHFYDSAWLPAHAILSVLGIFVVCVALDKLRACVFGKASEKLFNVLKKRGAV